MRRILREVLDHTVQRLFTLQTSIEKRTEVVTLHCKYSKILFPDLFKETNSNLTSSDRLWLQYEKLISLDIGKRENLVSHLVQLLFVKKN